MKKGFTLIEVLTVIIIIGILSAVAMPQYRKAVDKSRFTKAQVMAKALRNSCERMVAEWGVEEYSQLPSAVQKITRLDIGSDSELPVGFSVTETTITGAGFRYSLIGNCGVSISKIEGTYKANFVFDGDEFACTEVDDEACTVYGLD